MAETKRGTIRSRIDRGVPTGVPFDAVMAALGALWIVGLALYANAALSGETVGTVARGPLYTGGLGMVLVLALAIVGGSSRADTLPAATPTGYGAGVVGMLVLGVGLLADLADVLGVGADGLVAPAAFALAIGGGLLAAGPLAAAWRRPRIPGAQAQLPAMLSAMIVLSAVTIATASAHPFVEPGASPAAVAALLFQTALLVGLALLLLARFEPVPGVFTLVLGGNGAVLMLVGGHVELLPAAIVAGVAFDVLYAVLDPAPGRIVATRTFGATSGVVVVAATVLVSATLGGLDWPIELASRAVLSAGVVGWLLTYLVFTPPIPAGTTRGETELQAGESD